MNQQVKTVEVDGQNIQAFTDLNVASQATSHVVGLLSLFAKVTPLGEGAASFVEAQQLVVLINNTLALELKKCESE